MELGELGDCKAMVYRSRKQS